MSRIGPEEEAGFTLGVMGINYDPPLLCLRDNDISIIAKASAFRRAKYVMRVIGSFPLDISVKEGMEALACQSVGRRTIFPKSFAHRCNSASYLSS